MSDTPENETVATSSCQATAYQGASVSLPVTVAPYAEIGQVIIHCCGSPTLSQPRETSCDSSNCTFTIRQNICVEIPFAFKAAVTKGQSRIRCGGVSSEGCTTMERGENC